MTPKLLYVGAKYDYGDKTRGLSFEHRNFHHPLQSWCAQQGWELVPYDFYTRGQELGLDAMTQELYELAQREKPSFLFAVLVDFHLDPRHEVFSEIGRTGETTTLHWFCDDHWRFEKYSRHVAPHFHYVTTTASSALPKYAELGLGDRVIKTQWACNHELYVPHTVPEDIDVSFVGMPHGDRVPFLNDLAARGLPVSVFGHGWQGRPRLPFHQMVRLFSRSKVNLNLSNASSLTGQQIKGRNFEVPGTGGFLLSGEADNLGEYYEDGREIVTYQGAEDLVAKAQYYLTHDTERTRIAERGYRRTVGEHTWHHRFDQIFRAIGQRVPRTTARQAVETAALSWQSPLWAATGWAEEARQFVLALDDADYPLAVFPQAEAGVPADLGPHERHRLEEMARRSIRGGVHVCHGLPTEFSPRVDARLNIGRTMWETDSLPEGWAEACNRMDQLWVPSEFNRDTFANAGVDPRKIAVIPGTLDVGAYDSSVPALPIEGARGFNFLSVFDWTLRKGWDVLVQAYVEEFAADEDVALIIKPSSSRGYTVEEMVDAMDSHIASVTGLSSEQTPDIIFQAAPVPQDLMPSLYRAADCYVLPTRGEGWGRPYMEAMAMGLPTIGTGWGGNLAFMTADNSFLIPSELTPVSEAAWREQPLYQGQQWAEPDVAALRRLMREVFDDRDGARRIGAQARRDIEQRFSPAHVAARMRAELDSERLQKAA